MSIEFHCLVCGLVSRMNDPVLSIVLQKHDFKCLSETKCDNADIENVKKEFASLVFQIVIQNRHNLTNWRSEGVLVAIKDGLFKYCKSFYYINDFIIIIKLDKRLFNIDKHIFLFAVYIPPYMTRYSKFELFDDLSNVILNYDSVNYYHLICGDMNAHTQ